MAAFLFGPADPPVDGVDVSGMIGAADVLQGDLDSLVAALDAGLAYVNVHTVMYGAGEVRGQIGPTAATQTNPGAVVEAYVAAINAGDAARAAALFATDGVILAPRNSFSGRVEIEADLQNFIDRGGSLTRLPWR